VGAVAKGDLASLPPDALEAVFTMVRQALTARSEEEQDPPALSDTFIAGVVDDAFRKGIEMRNVQRVDGPYPHGSRFRLRVVELGGRRRYVPYPTEREADRARKAFEKVIAERAGWTVEEAITEYENLLTAKGNKPTGIKTTSIRLRVFFAPMLREKVAQLTEGRATHLLDVLASRPNRQGDGLSVDTRKNTLAVARTFGSWLAEGGHIKGNVFEGLKVQGRRRKGKQQLRYDETDRWYTRAVAMAEAGDEGALAVLVAHDGDLRSSEVWRRVVRDLDRDCTVIWVSDAKTSSGNRTVELSAAVARLLAEKVRGKAPADPVFPEAEALNDPKGWMIRAATRVCEAAGVPRVTPHGLRGSGATTDVIDEVVAKVSRKLGHAGTAVTVGHYLDGDVLGQLRRLLARSQRGPTGSEPGTG
jgi:integrase